MSSSRRRLAVALLQRAGFQRARTVRSVEVWLRPGSNLVVVLGEATMIEQVVEMLRALDG